MTGTEPIQPDQLSARSPDKAWKEALTLFFEDFVKLLFPHIHDEIDWKRGYTFLDKELVQIARGYAAGTRVADKLAEVYLKSGGKRKVLAHIEIEGKGGRKFDERMYVYNYRIFDKEFSRVASLAVVINASPRAMLGKFELALWGCRVLFEYPVIHVRDLVGRLEELELSDNPFAIVILAQLKVLEAGNDNGRKFAAKRQLIRRLYQRGFSRKERADLFRIIDWLIVVPDESEERIRQEIYEFEEGEKEMLVTSWEMLAKREGLQEGRASLLLEMLTQRFGQLSLRLQKRISQLTAEELRTLGLAMSGFTEVKQLRDWLAIYKSQPAKNGNGKTRVSPAAKRKK
ncbi:MAG: DUF4351 domain-containing protein [Blastocatellia bacterium]